MRTCLSQRICFIPLQKRRRGNTRSTAWCRAQIPIPWIWNDQEAMTSPLSLARCKECFVCWLLYCPLPAYRRKSKAYRRMLLQIGHQDEWETIPINIFCIHPVNCLILLLGSSYLTYSRQPEEWTLESFGPIWNKMKAVSKSEVPDAGSKDPLIRGKLLMPIQGKKENLVRTKKLVKDTWVFTLIHRLAE